MLRGSIEALDGRRRLRCSSGTASRDGCPRTRRPTSTSRCAPRATRRRATGLPQQIEHAGRLGARAAVRVDGPGGPNGAICLARRARPFQADEVELLSELVAKAQTAAADILGHHALREEAVRDPLTGLGNRRKLAADVDSLVHRRRRTRRACSSCSTSTASRATTTPSAMSRATRCSRASAPSSATRSRPTARPTDSAATSSAPCSRSTPSMSRRSSRSPRHALSETGEGFAITASYGVVLLPARGRQSRSRRPTRRRADVRAQAQPLLRRPRPGARRAHAHHAGQATIAARALQPRRRTRRRASPAASR